MGPRSDNRGYEQLREVHPPAASKASMGPRSDNRGYGPWKVKWCQELLRLQWVHGPITVVMAINTCRTRGTNTAASIGPRSHNPGYAGVPTRVHGPPSPPS